MQVKSLAFFLIVAISLAQPSGICLCAFSQSEGNPESQAAACCSQEKPQSSSCPCCGERGCACALGICHCNDKPVEPKAPGTPLSTEHRADPFTCILLVVDGGLAPPGFPSCSRFFLSVCGNQETVHPLFLTLQSIRC